MFGAATLYETAWRRHRPLHLSLAAGMFAFQLLIAGVYGTTVRESLSIWFSGIRLPRFVRAFGGTTDLFSPEGWLGVGYAHPLTLVMLTAWAVAVAGAAAAGDIENGTAEMIASRPVGRRLVLAARAAVCATGLLLLLAAAYAGTWAGTILVPELAAFDSVRGLYLPLATLPILAAIAGFSFLASAMSSVRSHANALAIAFTVISYFLNFAAVLWDPLADFAPLSIFHYLDPAGWMRRGVTPADWIPTLLGAVLFVAALEVFERRDIAP